MNRKLGTVLWGNDKPGRAVTLGIQHVFAMFGSTVLVPALTGLDPAVTLFCMGIGTLIFHLITKGIVPAFMGSSFSFITSICAVANYCTKNSVEGFASYVGWGIIASGALYLILALLVKLLGAKRITNFFPPVVTGCMIVIIGMMLAPTAMGNITTVNGSFAFRDKISISETAEQKDGFIYYADEEAWFSLDDISANTEAVKEGDKDIYVVTNYNGAPLYEEASKDNAVKLTPVWKNWVVAIVTILTILIVMFLFRGFIKLIPILIGIIVGYLTAIALGMVDFTKVAEAAWLNVPEFSFFFKGTDANAITFAITMIAPISVVTFVEHVGDITANGAVTGHNYIEEPGLHRTLLGCGLASVFSGGMGGPAATTYSENTGVLAATKNYNPATLRIAAAFAIILAFIGKVSGVLTSIPAPVMGGVSVILFGMITSVGLRMLVESGVDFTKSYNLVVAGIMLVFGLGLPNGITVGSVTVSGIAIAAVLGIVLAKVLPKKDADERKADKDAAAAQK